MHTPAEHELPRRLVLQDGSLLPQEMSLNYRKNPQHKFNVVKRISEVAAKLRSSRLHAIGISMLPTLKLCYFVKEPAAYALLFYVLSTHILLRSLQPSLLKIYIPHSSESA